MYAAQELIKTEFWLLNLKIHSYFCSVWYKSDLITSTSTSCTVLLNVSSRDIISIHSKGSLNLSAIGFACELRPQRGDSWPMFSIAAGQRQAKFAFPQISIEINLAYCRVNNQNKTQGDPHDSCSRSHQ